MRAGKFAYIFLFTEIQKNRINEIIKISVISVPRQTPRDRRRR